MKPILRIFLFIMTFFSAQVAFAQDVQPKGAVCVIDHDERVVLIKEMITGKFSLPGGIIDEGETSQQAAEREAWEEAGLVVTAKELLHLDKYAAIYRCTSNSDIVVFDLETENGFYRIPSWFAPHYGVETDAVYLSEPFKLAPEQYRYPDQLSVIQHWLSSSGESENTVYWVSDLVNQAPEFRQKELQFISSFRMAIDQLPSVVGITVKALFTLLNETSSETFFYFIFIVALVYLGRETALTIMFGIVLSIVLAGLAKQGLALPRPFVYIPQLQLTEAIGFGMPSFNGMLATIIYGTIYLALKRRGISNSSLKRWCIFFVGLVFTQSLARVWLGVHFPSDSIVGVALGMMVVVHFASMEKKHGELLYNIMGSVYFWLLMSVIMSGIAFVMTFMNYLYIAAVCWGITLAVKLSRVVNTPTIRGRIITLISLILVVVLARWGVDFGLGLLKDSSSLDILVIKTISNFSLILGVIVLASWLPNRFINAKKK